MAVGQSQRLFDGSGRSGHRLSRAGNGLHGGHQGALYSLHQRTFEITEYAIVFIPFLAAAWLLKRGGHVVIDVLVTRLKPRTQALMSVVSSILCTVLCGVLAWYAAQITWELYQSGHRMTHTGELALPQWTVLIIIPISLFLVTLTFIRIIFQDFSKLKHG